MDTIGLTRYSLFVYGGVRVQPRANIQNNGTGLPRGNRVDARSFTNVNAQVALHAKMRALQGAQNTAVKKETLPDGRIRYYEQEKSSRTPGPTRGSAYVTEHNPKTGQVRSWYESYNHQGSVNRVHPKTLNGQNLTAQHYPPTGAEKNSWRFK